MIGPPDEHRLTRRVDRHPGDAFLVAHLLQGHEGPRVIEARLRQLRSNESRAQIRRYEETVDLRIAADPTAHFLELFLGEISGVSVVVGLRDHCTGFGDVDPPGSPVGQAPQQVVVDARELVDTQRQTVEPAQRFVGEDGSFVDFEGDHDHIGPAEGVADRVVQLDVGVVLGEEVRELREHLHVRNEGGEAQRHQEDRTQRAPRTIEEEPREFADRLVTHRRAAIEESSTNRTCPFPPARRRRPSRRERATVSTPKTWGSTGSSRHSAPRTRSVPRPPTATG